MGEEQEYVGRGSCTIEPGEDEGPLIDARGLELPA